MTVITISGSQRYPFTLQSGLHYTLWPYDRTPKDYYHHPYKEPRKDDNSRFNWERK